MTNKQFIEAYIEGKTKYLQRNNNLLVVSDVLASYGIGHPIIYKVDNGTWIVNKFSYSRTTTRHQTLVKQVLQEKGFKYIEIEIPTHSDFARMIANEDGSKTKVTSDFLAQTLDTKVSTIAEKKRRGLVTKVLQRECKEIITNLEQLHK
jgi:hypothetical protein